MYAGRGTRARPSLGTSLPQKEQVGDLLDDFNGVGDAAGPEGVPDLIDFVAQVTGEHGGSLKGAVREPESLPWGGWLVRAGRVRFVVFLASGA